MLRNKQQTIKSETQTTYLTLASGQLQQAIKQANCSKETKKLYIERLLSSSLAGTRQNANTSNGELDLCTLGRMVQIAEISAEKTQCPYSM